MCQSSVFASKLLTSAIESGLHKYSSAPSVELHLEASSLPIRNAFVTRKAYSSHHSFHQARAYPSAKLRMKEKKDRLSSCIWVEHQRSRPFKAIAPFCNWEWFSRLLLSLSCIEESGALTSPYAPVAHQLAGRYYLVWEHTNKGKS